MNRVMSKRDSKSRQQWLIPVVFFLVHPSSTSLKHRYKWQSGEGSWRNAHGTQQTTRGLVLFPLGRGSVSEAQVLYHL